MRAGTHRIVESRLASEPLLRRCIEGESQAANRLFPRLAGALLPAVRNSRTFRVLRTRYTEEDVLSELWRSLLERKSLESFEDRGPGSLRAYLRGCLDRLLLELLRRETSQKRGRDEAEHPLNGSTLLRGLVAVAPSPSTEACVDDLVDRCRQVLPAREAAVWPLRVTDGLEFAEIASREGISAAAARGLFHRAVLRLQERGLL